MDKEKQKLHKELIEAYENCCRCEPGQEREMQEKYRKIYDKCVKAGIAR